MEPKEIFKEVMKSEEFKQHFGLTDKQIEESIFEGSSDCKPVELVKDVIFCVANNKTVASTFQGILKKMSE